MSEKTNLVGSSHPAANGETSNQELPSESLGMHNDESLNASDDKRIKEDPDRYISVSVSVSDAHAHAHAHATANSDSPISTDDLSNPGNSKSNIDNHFEKLSISTNKPAPIRDMTSSDLYTRINSKEFEIFHCISLLQHNSNIGIQYYICKRIQTFPIGELRFFAPQFLQLLITMEAQSMALEEMIKHICTKDPHFSLVTFWHLQAMLQDLSKEPESIGFQTCKRLVNELQYQLFNYSTNAKTHTSSLVSSSGVVPKYSINTDFKPNVYPSIVLATSLLSGVSVPESTNYVEPLVRMQGKQVKTLVFELVKDIKKNLTENLTKKNTLNNAKMSLSNFNKIHSQEGQDLRRTRSSNFRGEERKSSSPLPKARVSSNDMKIPSRKSEEIGFGMIDSYADMNLPNLRKPSLKGKNQKHQLYHVHSSTSVNTQQFGQSNEVKSASLSDSNLSTSMPDLLADDIIEPNNERSTLASSPTPSITDFANNYTSDGSYASSIRNSSDYRESLEFLNHNNTNTSSLSPVSTNKPLNQHVQLSDIQKGKLLKSNYFKNETQFVIALQNISIRLSKVPREARLSTLKAELATLNKDLPCEVDIPMLLPKNKKGKLHKLCRIAINESAVLNSAERVPYLLLVEYLSDEVDFDPHNSNNKKLLRTVEDLNENNKNDKYKFDLSYKTSKNRNVSTSSTLYEDYEDRKNRNDDNQVSDVEEGDLADISIVKLTNKMDRNGENKISLGSILSTSDNNDKIPLPSTLPVNASSDHEHNIATQLRIASIMLTQLDSPNSPLPQLQASQIKDRIIDSMQNMQERFSNNEEVAGERKLSNDMKVAGLSYLGEDWNTKKSRIRKESKFGHLENWDLFSMIAKTGDDLAQEAFACQLIHLMANIWYQDKVKVWVKRMKILVTSISTGLVETITNAVSVHSIKKALEKDMLEHNEIPVNGVVSLTDHFKRLFGDENSARYKLAQENFSISLAAYSVICYILQIKDRHNGNIMLDSEGHIVHIDFGFLLSNSPGSVGFESAPFKLTQEYVDLLGGVDSYYFNKFKTLTKEAFKSLRRNSQCIIDMVELMQQDSSLPCFKAGENTSVLLKQRFQLHLSDEEVDSFIENVLINKSLNSAYTRLYDQFQLLTQGIYI